MMLKSTTRHVHIYAATVDDRELTPSDSVLTLDIDPDNEFNWPEAALNKTYAEFDRMVDSYAGEDLTDYNLRRIGSDLENFVRALLQAGEISYNLKTRALNYSMGLPRVVPESASSEADVNHLR
ncbi:NAD(P)H-quinone oxidoreductase [filamentous cyanobacterium CCP5]|nr:NAD(P)H-quinone oxidoreductase [filamentous cyanobacterium CCP5]